MRKLLVGAMVAFLNAPLALHAQVVAATDSTPAHAGPLGPYFEFQVDTSGRAIPATFRVLRSSHVLFSEAARAAIDSMRYEPALLHGKKVIQVVQQPFNFSVSP